MWQTLLVKRHMNIPSSFVHVAFRNCAEKGADPGFSEGGSDKFPPTFSNGYCCLTSPFFARKNMVKIFALVSL